MNAEALNFLQAIEANDINRANAIISSSSIDVHALLPVLHKPAVVFAAFCGHTAMIELLLSVGANIDAVDSGKQTACHAAIERGHDDALAALLARAPNLALTDVNWCTPLDIALKKPNAERFVTMLLAAGAPLDDGNAICDVAATGTTAIQALIDRGVVLSQVRAGNGMTPLYFVVAYGFNPSAMAMLVNVCGVDLNAQDSSGNTCCHHAAFGCKEEVLRWLVDAGANLESANNLAETVLHKACSGGSVSSTLLLLAAGANVHAQSEGGLRACHLAARRVQATTTMDLIHALLGGGADIDAANDVGTSARQILAERGFAIVNEAVESARHRIVQLRNEISNRN